MNNIFGMLDKHSRF